MSTSGLAMRCQRCGTGMEMRDPAPGGAWKPDQFWVCPKCGRHFWTTYPNQPKAPEAEPKPAASPAKADAGPASSQRTVP